jgi:NADPH:quinone reductase-like Zn-dependent oxidoreductase
MRAFELKRFGVENLEISDVALDRPTSGDVLVRFHATSINYRDLMMVNGIYNPKLRMPIIPFSDGAGEVVEVGEGVTRWKVGDRVMPIFMQGWIDGPIEFGKARTALGGDLDGCLREFGVFSQEGLVRIPDGYSFEEAATLPCAAVTAYNALFESGNAVSGETVLVQGTGGVSVFATQFANAIGCRVIGTSSSDEKLSKLGELGATDLVNYRKNEDWDKVVLELTERRGVDHVIEVGGAGTMQRSVNSVRLGGHIAVIGVLSGKGSVDPTLILMKALRMHGIFVGSREMFERMVSFIETHSIKPVIDSVFSFDEVPEALHHMESQKHFGKIVIKIS